MSAIGMGESQGNTPTTTTETASTLNYDVPYPPDKAERFLDCLRVELGRFGNLSGEGRYEDDGTWTDSAMVSVPGARGRQTGLKWTIRWLPGETLSPLTVSAPGGERSSGWRATADGIVRRALLGTINPDQVRQFVRLTFAHAGPLLHGAYYLPGGVRVSPAAGQSQLQRAERVIHIDQDVLALDSIAAVELARVQARRLASLLSLFLDIGIYEIPVERRWVIEPASDGRLVSRCLSLGFVDPDGQPNAMPKKNPRLAGGFYEPDRTSPDYMFAAKGTTLRCPSDIRKLFRAVGSLESSRREAYYNAAALYQMGRVLGRRYPSAGLAYMVAAVDALNPSASDHRANFKALVSASDPGFPGGWIDWLYGDVRSRHFHAGTFTLGEFDQLKMGPFGGSRTTSDLNARMAGHAILHHTLIKWLLHPPRLARAGAQRRGARRR